MNIENKKNFDLEYKIITLGDIGVGKTSIINRFINDSFNDEEALTLGIKFSFQIVKAQNDKLLKLNIIDTSGQEKYRSLPTSYFRNVDVVLFIFDLSQMLSFENIKKWINTFNQNNNGKYVKKLYLVGNKNDLGQVVDQKMIDDFSQNNNLPYRGISAKTSYQVKELFELIANDLIEEVDKKSIISIKSRGSRILARPQNNNKRQKKCCG